MQDGTRECDRMTGSYRGQLIGALLRTQIIFILGLETATNPGFIIIIRKVNENRKNGNMSISIKKFKGIRSTKKVMATIFWDGKNVVRIDYLPYGTQL